jgi:hypothetical protein
MLTVSPWKDSGIDGVGQNTFTLKALLQQSDLDAGPD